MFVGSCLATKVFMGNLPTMGGGWVIIKWANGEQRSTTNKIVGLHLMHPDYCQITIMCM